MTTFCLFAQSKRWVGTWATAQQLIEKHNMPPLTLTGNTLRQIVRVSIGGDTIRLKISNEFSDAATEIKEVQIAVSKGGSVIDTNTIKSLKFDGRTTFLLDSGAMAVSDPIAFDLTPRMDVAITILYGNTSTTLTGHSISCNMSYLMEGNALNSALMTGRTATDHWYSISTIDVLAPDSSACIAILGNSITDGLGSTLNSNNRWTDVFSESLLQQPSTSQLGVLNLGITANRVLDDIRGLRAILRFDRDILDQSGLRYIIVFIGVNDIGTVKTAEDATRISNNLINAYIEFIRKAHANHVRIYGATILPFNGSVYYNPYSDSCRSAVNEWIRTESTYDEVIDFDKLVRSTTDSTRLITSYQNDGLHPDAFLYEKMGQGVNLDFFAKADTIFSSLSKTQTVEGYNLKWIAPSSIEFEIPDKSPVSIQLFNILGTEVKHLNSRVYPAGKHTVAFETNGLQKGIYFCTLKSGPFLVCEKVFIQGF